MNIQFLDLKNQYNSIRHEIDRAINDVIESSSFVLGQSVTNFEEAYADYCQCQHCIAVNSGTSALLLILKALGIGRDDEVITAANTFIATVAAIRESGATPALIDIDPNTRNINLNLIEKAITPKTRAIIPVHLYGLMVDMERLIQIARKHNLLVIEDAAQAQGAKFKDKPAGSYGIAAGFSFYPAKNLGAYGEAGAILTSDNKLNQIIRKLRNHGSEQKYFHDSFGYNARMDGIQGAVLGIKLNYLDKWNEERNRVARRYLRNMTELPITLPGEFDSYYQVYHQFVIEVENRAGLQKFLGENNIPTMIHYPIPVHKQKAFVEAGYTSADCPVTERLADRILSLPIYPELTDDEIDFISDKIKEFLN